MGPLAEPYAYAQDGIRGSTAKSMLSSDVAIGPDSKNECLMFKFKFTRATSYARD